MVSIDWSTAAGVLLVGGGAITGVVAVLLALVKNWASIKKRLTFKSVVSIPTASQKTQEAPLEVANDMAIKKRGADEPAPPGAIKWVQDIREAMGSAKAESILASLTAGESRDQARSRRIAELEVVAPVKQAVAAKATVAVPIATEATVAQ